MQFGVASHCIICHANLLDKCHAIYMYYLTARIWAPEARPFSLGVWWTLRMCL